MPADLTPDPHDRLTPVVLYNATGTEGTPNVFKTVELTAATGETTIWTPASGKKFRLMGFALASGGVGTIALKDNTLGTTIFITKGQADQMVVVNLGMGILSGAADRVLTVTRTASATLIGTVWGTEE